MPGAPAEKEEVKAPPAPPAVYNGEVKVRVFEAAKKVDRIKKGLAKIDGVSNVNIDANSVTVSYSGPFSGIADVEKTVKSQASKAALVSPAIVKFKPLAVKDEQKLIDALKGIAGVVEVCKANGAFCIFAPAEDIDLAEILKVAESSGHSGSISSHAEIDMELKLGEQADTDKLKSELSATKFVLNVKLDGSHLKVLVVRGRVSKNAVKKVVEKCGVSIAKK